MAKRVVTKGGGDNLYKITNSFDVFIIKVKTFTNKKIKIGSARNLEDCLSIIKSYSGNQIKEIREW